MKADHELVYDCPACGQGGLELVCVKAGNEILAYVCSECDRIWLKPDKVSFGNSKKLKALLESMGLKGNWTSLERVTQGVPWEDIAPEYQEILEREKRQG